MRHSCPASKALACGQADTVTLQSCSAMSEATSDSSAICLYQSYGSADPRKVVLFKKLWQMTACSAKSHSQSDASHASKRH